MKKSWFGVGIIMLLIIMGCNNHDNKADKTEETKQNELKPVTAYVTSMENHTVLVGDILYTVDGNTSIKTDQDEKQTLANLTLGTKVKITNTGQVAKSYPGQATAKQIIILTDDTSVKEQRAAASALAKMDAKKNTIVIESIKHLKGDKAYEIKIHNLSADKNQEQKSVLRIDENTYEIQT